ncbi:MAG TPA: class I tRNA ligase family protein, partial [Rhodocyclaceae bacterium]|nr:class I tRNA ligase family protein [Rhodocyclaceae bacterium]
VEGAYRFLKRIWAFGVGLKDRKAGGKESGLRRDIHLNLKQANYDLGRMQFNTVASAAMKMLNALEKAAGDPHEREGFSILLRLLSPITPHVCHALWQELGYGDDILTAPWPEPLEEALVQDEIELVLQVNGKTRGSVRVPAAADKAAIEAAAVAAEAAQKFMEGKPARKVVIVPGRLVNIVV